MRPSSISSTGTLGGGAASRHTPNGVSSGGFLSYPCCSPLSRRERGAINRESLLRPVLLQDPESSRLDDRLRPVPHVQLPENILQVLLHRRRRDEQLAPGVGVREASGDQAQDFDLAGAELIVCGGGGGRWGLGACRRD